MLYQPNTRRLVFALLMALSVIMTIFEWSDSYRIHPATIPLLLVGTAVYMLIFHKFLVPNSEKGSRDTLKKFGDLGTTAGIIEISIIIIDKIASQI